MAFATLLHAFSALFLVAGCSATIDDTCTRCLCEFINEGPVCNFMVGCHDGVCGPYALTQGFWLDGGSPSVGGGDATAKYRNCANDMNCAETTIRNYMTRYHKDCNGDGFEDCYDFASIHFNGPFGCQKPIRESQRVALKACLERSNSIEPNNDPSGDPNDDGEIVDFNPRGNF